MSDQNQPRFYSIIPAAGKSQRMGREKLILPWPPSRHCFVDKDSNTNQIVPTVSRDRLAGFTVIDKVLREWKRSLVMQTVVVLRSGGCVELKRRSQRWAKTIEIDDPPDMKASIQSGLRWIDENQGPTADDWCFISPADLPLIHSALINRIANWSDPENLIRVPVFDGRKGHPILFPWKLTSKIWELRDSEGIDQLLKHEGSTRVPVPDLPYFGDMDTPDQYLKSC